MSVCSQCGHDEDFIKCGFRGCQNEAEYEGWYRVLDFANQPTGLIQKMQVCHSCVKFLIGNSPTKYAPDAGESAASVSISPASEVPASEAESNPTTTQVM